MLRKPHIFFNPFYAGGTVRPRLVAPGPETKQAARDVRLILETFAQYIGQPQSEAYKALNTLRQQKVGVEDKRWQGLVHLIGKEYIDAEMQSPLSPQEVRKEVFERAAVLHPLNLESRSHLLLQIASEWGCTPAEIEHSLYADLADRKILQSFEVPTPEAVLSRYNLAQAQGLLYWARRLTITLRRTEPFQVKYLFKHIKRLRLMHDVRGNPELGYEISLDGPISLHRASTHYGADLAQLLPALPHIQDWSFSASLEHKGKSFTWTSSPSQFPSYSHYLPPNNYDSPVELAFANAWAKLDTPWSMLRELEVIDLGSTVLIPDFVLENPTANPSRVSLEIVGYFNQAYFERKYSKLLRSPHPALILAISRKFREFAPLLEQLPCPVVWYSTEVSARSVLQVLGQLPQSEAI
ncbi:DUF790 family protein [Leptolyngbya sp. FACHB-261]|uniref:DUF790 family protein n=1 Tax=Leptolyngbya sp. FACHB-261 TaxID=2692806 RepID=UPI0016854738|nr:DUF790 family protein [Leptolyngbya sp. FACHB-261]MBD2100311.1 DUF790 family protein [Leptolyngbya sp. FACHB-261]